MSIELIIILVVAIIIVLKLFEIMGKAAPFVLGYGLIYWSHFYIWDWISWMIGFIFTIGMLSTIWKSVNPQVDKKREW